MTISDLLTLIGILLAIIAFVSERTREYVFLKMSRPILWLIALLFLHIHLLLFYSWWSEKFVFMQVFEFEDFPLSSTWAYIISICTLFFFSWKIFWGNFPLSRKNKLLMYYKKLLLKNDIAFLAELVEKYHLEEVIAYLKKRKTIKIEVETLPFLHSQEYNKQYNKIIKGRKLIYGGAIYGNIILNETFLDSVANVNPYIFANVIQQLNDIELKDDDFVNRYLKVLMTNKNGNFFREIRNNQNLNTLEAYQIEVERPILYALFNDVTVCSINEAWRGVGEPAIIEMHEEAQREYSALRESDREQDSDTIWTFRITIAIWYFDIMVRQSIVQKVNDHMWMFYYYHFVKAILANMKNLPFPDSEMNRKSRNFDLIEMIFTKMMDWKDVIVKSKNDELIKSVYDCMGQCVYELAITDKLRDVDKNYLISWVWEDLIKTSAPAAIGESTDNELTKEIVEVGFEMFKRPSMLFTPDSEYTSDIDRERHNKYLTALQILWNKKNIARLTAYNDRVVLFKSNVIDKLLPEK